MPKPIPQQELSALVAKGLKYLTANDWTLIADKATRLRFKAGDPLIQAGRRTHGVYILLSGAASVLIPGREILPALGPGQVCGEISFLDEQPATVSVVAKEAAEALYLDRSTLESLIELFPHLGSRFYRSLSYGLALRVRDVIENLSRVADDKEK